MATNQLAIVNFALVTDGIGPLQSLTDGSAKADAVSAIWVRLTEQLLAEHPWSFTKQLVQLSRHTTAPPTRWKYKFDLPADAVSVLAAYTSSAVGATQIDRYEILEDGLYTDAPTVFVLYQFAAEIDRWTPPFIAVLQHALAAAFAESLTDDAAKHDRHYAIAFGTPAEGRQGGLMGRAKAIDGQQSTPQVIEDFTLIAVRG